MRRITALATLAVAVLLTALPAAAAHTDGGVDEAWSEPMNHEPYWETRFSTGGVTAECTKYEGHNGYIPASYEAAVVHDGQWVRVYNPAPDNTAASGPANLNSPDPDDHFGSPHSWVMKCDITETPDTDYVCDGEEIVEVPDGQGVYETIEEATTACTSTTTIPEEEETTTTLPGLIETVWTASSTCEDLTAEWGEGISQINVTMRDPQFGDFEVDPFTESGQTLNASTGGETIVEFVLVPVVVEGYTAVPDQIVLTTEHCDEPTTTTVAPTMVDVSAAYVAVYGAVRERHDPCCLGGGDDRHRVPVPQSLARRGLIVLGGRPSGIPHSRLPRPPGTTLLRRVIVSLWPSPPSVVLDGERLYTFVTVCYSPLYERPER